MIRVAVDLSNVDWPLLRRQKETLLRSIAKATESREDAGNLQGILHLLDHVQDEAVETLGEAAVFGEPDPPSESRPRRRMRN